MTGIVIYNPTAGRGHAARMRQSAQTILGSGWQWRATERPGHAVELARQAAQEGIATVAACGGDGTVGDVARGLIGSRTALGVLPLGTGNDVARNLGIPLDLPAACEILLAGFARAIDMGEVNGLPFLNNTGAGFDSQVMKRMNSSGRLGRGSSAFLLAILRELPGFRPFSLTVTFDDQPAMMISAMMISVLNGPAYAGGIRACPDNLMDDGAVDVMIIKALSKPRLFALIPKVLAGRHRDHPAVLLRRVQRLEFVCDPIQPLTIDGDLQGETPALVRVLPRCLRVVVP